MKRDNKHINIIEDQNDIWGWFKRWLEYAISNKSGDEFHKTAARIIE